MGVSNTPMAVSDTPWLCPTLFLTLAWAYPRDGRARGVSGARVAVGAPVDGVPRPAHQRACRGRGQRPRAPLPLGVRV